MRVESSNLDEVVLQIDVGIGPGEWTVMAPGFWFDLPRSVVVYSPDPSTPGDLPELHHGMNLEAMIMFSRAGASAHEIVPTGPGGKPLRARRSRLRTVRCARTRTTTITAARGSTMQ